jgi:hypothetical protein
MTLRQRYAAWRKTPESEEVFAQMHRMARQTAGRGVRFGVKAFAEIMRWECMLRGERTEKVKVNNSYVSLIARELGRLDPSLTPFFETRKLAHERQKFPEKWLQQVSSPRRIPTARPWPRVAA